MGGSPHRHDTQSDQSDDISFRLVSVLGGHTEQVRHLAFSPDGTLLAAACLDGTIWLWHVPTATALHTLIDCERPRPLLGRTPPPRLAFSPDGMLLAAAIGNGVVRIYDHAGTRMGTLADAGWQVRDVSFSPSGKYIVTGDEEGMVRWWDATSLVTVWRHRGGGYASSPELSEAAPAIRSLTFSPDGRLLVLVAGSAPGTVQVQHVDEDALSMTWRGAAITPSRGLSAPAFSLDGAQFAVGAYDAVYEEPCAHVFDATSLRPVAVYRPPDDVPVAVRFAAGGTLLAVAGGGRGIVWLWDVEHARLVGELPSHTGGWGAGSPAWKIGALSVSHAGTLLAVAGMDTPVGVPPDVAYHGPVDWTIKLWAISTRPS